jgi:hypothetical protein
LEPHLKKKSILEAIWLAEHFEAWIEGMKGLVNAAEALAELTDCGAYSFCYILSTSLDCLSTLVKLNSSPKLRESGRLYGATLYLAREQGAACAWLHAACHLLPLWAIIGVG